MGLSKFQSFLLWLGSINPGDKQVYQLKEESIRKDGTIRDLTKMVQSRDGQLARKSAEDNIKKEEDTDREIKEDYVKDLERQKSEIDDEKFKTNFSLNKFYEKLFGIKIERKSKFGKNLELTDKDDEVSFGNFGEIVFLEGGHIGVTNSEGDLINTGKTLSQLFWKPDSLSNHLKRGRIPLTLTRDGKNIQTDLPEEYEDEEVPDMIYDEEEGIYRESEVLTKPAKQIIIEKNEIIANQQTKWERLEQKFIDLKNELLDKQRAIRLLERDSSESQSELSKVMQNHMSLNSAISKMQNRIVSMTDKLALQEQLINYKDNVMQTLIDKLEKKDAMLTDEMAMEKLKEAIDWGQDKIPPREVRTEIIKEPTQPPPQNLNPGVFKR